MSFECKVCNKEYKSYQSLWNHKKKFHTWDKEFVACRIIDELLLKYICKFCNKKFDTKQKAINADLNGAINIMRKVIDLKEIIGNRILNPRILEA